MCVCIPPFSTHEFPSFIVVEAAEVGGINLVNIFGTRDQQLGQAGVKHTDYAVRFFVLPAHGTQ